MGKTRTFIGLYVDDYAHKQRWTDDLFVKAVIDVERGLNDGALGSSVFKRRIARKGAGSAAGHRIVVVIRISDKAFIVDAVARNVKAAHTPQEVIALRAFADRLLGLSDKALSLALKAGDLREIEWELEVKEDEQD